MIDSPSRAPELDAFLARSTPAVRDLALHLRALVLRACPGATEKVWPGWRMIGYATGPKMADVVCGVAPLKDAVALRFLRGEHLSDPAGMLAPLGRAGRQVKLRAGTAPDDPALAALLAAAFARHGTAGDPPGVTSAKPEPEMPVRDAAVRERTGRGWAEWMALLDAAGAREMAHGALARHLSGLGLDDWWAQTVTVGYERARKGRAKNQAADGYQVGASRTVGVPVERLWEAWEDEALRERWMGGARFTVRRATRPKSMRLTWGDDSRVDVLFSAKGEAKSQVSVDHRRLPDAAAVESMRAFWRERLGRMKRVLEE